jgi:hypothetical protein
MSNAPAPDPGLLLRRGPRLPAVVRAAILGSAWLPFFGLVTFQVPRWEPIFKKLEEKTELPLLTSLSVLISHWNRITFGLPLLAFLALVILSDLGVARAVGRLRRGGSLYWTWFVAVILLALCACLSLVVALLLPVLKMSSTIE